MSHVKRIFVWTILLIGSAVLFYFWATNQMYMIATTETISPEVAPVIAVVPHEEKSQYYQVLSSSTMQVLLEKDLDKAEWSTSTLKISSSTIDSADLSFVFPNEKSVLYQGCTYKVELNLGEGLKPNYIGVLLTDAGTKKDVSQKVSGLEYSLTFKDGRFLWSVGGAWSGEYYLSVPMIDGVDTVIRSKKFLIQEKPDGYVCER